MRFWISSAALFLAAPASAHSYRVVLDEPVGGKLLNGHGGLHAADHRTGTALVRLIAPGNEVDKRGTVRVLVMNLGPTPFEFGPDDVSLRLRDGTTLSPTPVQDFEKGRVLVERESRHASSVDMSIRNSISSLAQQSGAGASAPMPGVSAPGANALSTMSGQDLRTETLMLPGGRTLDAIYQLLITLKVEPQHAWGGYYVFDIPRDVQRRHADQPMSIIVRTGSENHLFPATLRWK